MTTGMSAPPMGITSSHPSTSERASTTALQAPAATGDSTVSSAQIPSPSVPTTSNALSAWRPGRRMGSPRIVPLSLRKATRLPLNVTPPMSSESAIITAAVVPIVSATVPVAPASTVSSHCVETATRAEAAPPKPLNRATISGICVICTRTAQNQPTTEPTTSPPRIQR